MKGCALVFGFLALLTLPTPAFALREIMTGNQPIGPESGHGKELLAALNIPERVLLSEGGLDASLEVYFKGGPKALNDAFRRFAAIPAGKHEVVLMPFAAKPFDLGKESFAYDWTLHVPGSRRTGGKTAAIDHVTLTVYIPNPNPPDPADPKAIRAWIADLSKDEFKTRERANKELAAIGPSAARLFREALGRKPTADVRDRLEKLLGEVSKELQVDVLEIPAGLTVVGPDDLLARARAKLADKAGHIRGDGAHQLADCGVPAAEILPELEKLLKSEAEWESHAAWGAAMAAYRLGADAKPLLPALQTAAGSKIEYVATACKHAIAAIEKAKPEPVSEAEAKKRATVRTEIKELVAGRTAKR